MVSNKPTIVIVPGSFCPASLYDSLSEKLRKFGYEIIVGELPSVACEPPQPAATMEEDAAIFHQIIEQLCDQGKQVVIFAHSYGGTVANESAKSLSKTERDNQGKPGGIIKIVYLASIIIEVGKARLSDFRPRYLTLKDDYLFLEPITGAEDIIGDVPFEQALKVTEKMPHHSAVSFSGLLTHAGYKWVPVVYILCEKDKVVPPEYQRGFIEVLRKETNKPVPTISLDSSHCPNISMPEELANAVQKAIVEL